MADGVWRTIKGRRVFIEEGQSLTEAMKKSGKFKIEKKDIKKTTGNNKKIIQERYEKNKKIFKEEWDKGDLTNARARFYKRIGYDKKPKVVSSEEFKKISKDKVVMMRSTATEGYKQYIDGEYKVSSLENSMYGTGVYYAYAKEDIEYYKGLDAKSGKDYTVFNSVYSSEARIIDSKTLDMYKEEIRANLGNNREFIDNVILADNGVLASSLGYDGILFDNVKYFLSTNRGKMIVEKK